MKKPGFKFTKPGFYLRNIYIAYNGSYNYSHLKEVNMNCENLRETIELGLNELRTVEIGSEQYKNGAAGLAKLIEAESKQSEAATKDFQSGAEIDIARQHLELDKDRLTLDAEIASREAEIRELQAQTEAKGTVIKALVPAGAVVVALAEIGSQTYLETTGHLYSPLRGLTNLIGKIRL